MMDVLSQGEVYYDMNEYQSRDNHQPYEERMTYQNELSQTRMENTLSDMNMVASSSYDMSGINRIELNNLSLRKYHSRQNQQQHYLSNEHYHRNHRMPIYQDDLNQYEDYDGFQSRDNHIHIVSSGDEVSHDNQLITHGQDVHKYFNVGLRQRH